MYDIRQFKPSLYLLVLLGITGFAIASGSTGLWVVSVAFILVNVAMVSRGRFRPIPRMLANGIVLLSLVYVALRVTGEGPPILTIGQFLVVLQVVKLYEQRGNRDFGQLIILSLLLMVAAAISTGSLAFGLLLTVYLFLSLYCCLLFHLKVETDAARKAMGLGDEASANQRRLRQDQRRLGSSMRRLTALVSVVAVGCAVVVFLVFPRNTGANFMSGPRFKSSKAVTGFSGQVGFQQIARITQNTTPVAYLQLLRNGQPVRGGEMLYLRGNTLDVYVSDPEATDRWTWKKAGHEFEAIPDGYDRAAARATWELGATMPRPGVVIEQRVELEPVALDVLPSLAGAFLVKPPARLQVRHSLSDNTLAVEGGTIRDQSRYTVWSTGQLPSPLSAAASIQEGNLDVNERLAADLTRLGRARDRVEIMRLTAAGQLKAEGRSRQEWIGEFQRVYGRALPTAALMPAVPPRPGFVQIAPGTRMAEGEEMPWPPPPEIVAFARDSNVSGTDRQGESLAERRLAMAGTTELDELIARNIERFLQLNYRYTLDLTDARMSADEDPMAWFVSEQGRRGHCEYFAGTAALACQSLGIPARVVVGFRTDEYNPSMDRFVVRQNHAHAWVEVFTERGWISIDPTSNIESGAQRAQAGLLQRLRHWFEFLEYSWANNVVAYDNAARDSLIQSVEADMMNRAQHGQGLWDDFQDWLEQQNLYVYSARLMAWLIALMAVGALAAIGWFLLERYRLRRRARRIGLAGLPPEQARELARQLAFFDDLTRLLARHGHERRPSQTPREFAQSLTTLPRHAFDLVLSLTDVFYRVRYGKAHLTRRRRKWVGHGLEKLVAALER